MKTFKLFIAIIAITSMNTSVFASNGINRVLIKEQSEQLVNIKTSLEENETMIVRITNEDGEVILKDIYNDSEGLISKTYDFNEARFGEYYIEVYINDELIKNMIIGEKEVYYEDLYILEVY